MCRKTDSAIAEKGKTMSKYKAVPIDTEDGHFDSMGEYARWQDLKLLQRGGVITGLKRQVKFELVPKQKTKDGKNVQPVDYVADFRYYDTRTGEWITEDFKGVKTDAYKIKKKLMLFRWGIEIRETGRSDL